MLRRNPYYATLYVFWSKVIFMEVIPYFVIIALNGAIVFDIFKSHNFRKQHVVQKTSTNSLSGRQSKKGMFLNIYYGLWHLFSVTVFALRTCTTYVFWFQHLDLKLKLQK